MSLRTLGWVVRADGTREDITFACEAPSDDGVYFSDFRTSDGELLVMQPGDEVHIPATLFPE